jgi:hypothetical protein
VRVRAGLALEFGDDPDWRAPLVSVRRGRARGLAGPGEEISSYGLGRAGQLGWAMWEEGRGGKGQVGLGRIGEKEKRRKKMGLAKKEKRERGKKNCIQMHLNLNLKFKFKWKINNKTMQYDMKCTKPIFPYISFYG